MESILITGGAGFIGSNFIEYIINKYSEYFIINLDKLTYAGSENNLSKVSLKDNYKFIHGDICDKELIKRIFNEYNVKNVINFAAETHVDNSILNPDEFIYTNVIGTFSLINTAKEHWLNEPFIYKEGYKNSRFHHISTDEVYGSLDNDKDFFTESSPYAPNSPYSAAKASSDFIVRSFNRTYGLNTIITNCSNNYGPKQHNEKFIPTIIKMALSGKQIPIYGDGMNIRDWLFVTDHCNALDLVFHNGKFGETYNIGGECEKPNIEVAESICKILDELKPKKDGTSYTTQVTFVKDRPGHDKRYAINCKKIKKELGWRVNTSFMDGLKETILWYISNIDYYEIY